MPLLAQAQRIALYGRSLPALGARQRSCLHLQGQGVGGNRLWQGQPRPSLPSRPNRPGKGTGRLRGNCQAWLLRSTLTRELGAAAS